MKTKNAIALDNSESETLTASLQSLTQSMFKTKKMEKSKYKIKFISAFLISLFPLNFLRILFYRILLKYEISFSSNIGFLTIISVDKAIVDGSCIGKFNTFHGPFILEIDKGSTIGDKNEFNCGYWVLNFKDSGYFRKCKIGKNTLITTLHFIDVVGGFELQDNSWIAGRSSEFWTHGAGVSDRAIYIGKDCYIGSAVKFAPGTSIASNNIVGLGSVVTKKFDAENTLVGGVPAKVIKENYRWKKGEK